MIITLDQWPFQDPRSEVPTIHKAYVRGHPHKILSYMVEYLHFRILKFPLMKCVYHPDTHTVLNTHTHKKQQLPTACVIDSSDRRNPPN